MRVLDVSTLDHRKNLYGLLAVWLRATSREIEGRFDRPILDRGPGQALEAAPPDRAGITSAGLEVPDVFRRHGDAYAQAHDDGHLGQVERRVMTAIELCRTTALGGYVELCANCGLVRHTYNSCQNRHCPKCQR